MTQKERLLARIAERTAVVGVVGLGYVGLPLAVAFAENGFRVVGIDVDGRKVGALNRGESYVHDIPARRVSALCAAQDASGNPVFRATTEFAAVAACDAVIIAVPTPLGKTRDPDMAFVIAAGEAVAAHVHPGLLVVLESTTYPGTTQELLLPMLEKGFARQEPVRVGEDFFLAFSPERIDPGRQDWTVETTPKVVGGVTPACREVTAALYSQAIDCIVPVSSTQAAEMVKLLENTFRAVNIALVNEIAIMCEKLGIDVWEVIDAAATKPYGFMKFIPGPGVGGHCIPLDPFYLSWKLKMLNYNARFIQLAGEINSEMPRYWVDRVQATLNEAEKSLKGSRVLVLGAAYKKDIDDVRESPALDIIELLRSRGADVRYHDPYVPRILHNGHGLASETDWRGAVCSADCVLIVTDHSAYDWSFVARQSRLLVDARNAVGRRFVEAIG